MSERLSGELRAFDALADLVAAGPHDRDLLLLDLCRTVQDAFGLTRADVVMPGAIAARHPLVERAAAERRAVTDGTRVAVPLVVDERCLGFLIGDGAGAELPLDPLELQLLTSLAGLAAAFLDRTEAQARLERSLHARTDFVSLASHELRTPIAVVHGIVSTLHFRGDELGAAQRHELRATAYAQTTRLALLTEQLLDLSRIEAGVVSRCTERMRPRRLVDELLLRIAPERRGDVLVEIDPLLELESDADGLERVLSNLIVNALRYGRPPVRVAVEGARFVVEDRGAGVPRELLPRLFERFARGSSDRTGAGLGLAIARSYAEAIGATLDYEDAEPHGARFTLELPRVAASL